MSKKQEIISIAGKVIHSKGYQATSISDILQAAGIGKGQFYHYFSSKHDLGLAVMENLITDWDSQLIEGILRSADESTKKLNNMLEWALTSHAEMKIKHGCAMGNLAIEMSEHDEAFRTKIAGFFNRWTDSVAIILDEMIRENLLDSTIDTKKSAQAIVSMIEGAILLMTNQQNIELMENVFEVIRKQYNLQY
ncbi:TetR/AcrR family transcriptional regulator [Oceanobacillus chungangensis]|uniref:TetR/AcrR family transcriptional regulator n=1 Tax=Oceanobacillus chungangensis TaxID=1229152 RepID=A0A3D8PXC4_9BACI|nr:TetR/AcrR family transcriptional regulator [Oceanobacillus chungangensis]RDW19789.1 TetR/AcrR family transcriptional regulator [Oceanobacillus chungangensis]